MKREHTKQLWLGRFKRMYGVEEGMYELYKSLVKDAGDLPKPEKVKSFIQSTFREISLDEEKHVILVEELMEILSRQSE